MPELRGSGEPSDSAKDASAVVKEQHPDLGATLTPSSGNESPACIQDLPACALRVSSDDTPDRTPVDPLENAPDPVAQPSRSYLRFWCRDRLGVETLSH